MSFILNSTNKVSSWPGDKFQCASRITSRHITCFVTRLGLYVRLSLYILVCFFQHIGPAIPEVSSIWFKLYLYSVTGQGPPSLLLSKGSRLRKLPDIFQVSLSIHIFIS